MQFNHKYHSSHSSSSHSSWLCSWKTQVFSSMRYAHAFVHCMYMFLLMIMELLEKFRRKQSGKVGLIFLFLSQSSSSNCRSTTKKTTVLFLKNERVYFFVLCNLFSSLRFPFLFFDLTIIISDYSLERMEGV